MSPHVMAVYSIFLDVIIVLFHFTQLPFLSKLLLLLNFLWETTVLICQKITTVICTEQSCFCSCFRQKSLNNFSLYPQEMAVFCFSREKRCFYILVRQILLLISPYRFVVFISPHATIGFLFLIREFLFIVSPKIFNNFEIYPDRSFLYFSLRLSRFLTYFQKRDTLLLSIFLLSGNGCSIFHSR